MSRNNIATETDVLRYKIAKEIFGEIEDCDGVRYIPSWEIFEKCLQQHKTIVDLKHKLEVAEKALNKMSEYAINDNDLYDLVSDFNIENERYDEDHFGIDTCDVVDYFKLKADKELKGE